MTLPSASLISNHAVLPAVDLDQIGIEGQLRVVLFDVLHQRRHEGRHAEQRGAGQVEFNLDVAQHPGFAPVIAGEIQGFLWRAGAFDRHRRLGEQRPAIAQFLHLIPGVLGMLVAVVRGDTVLAEAFLQAFDSLPGQAQAGTDDQVLIADGALIIEGELTLSRVNGADARLNPRCLTRHDFAHRPDGVFHIKCATANQRPGRLVVVL